MTKPAEFLAMDLGAESGRAVLGRFDGERVRLEEVHRFPNAPVRLPDGLHWDILCLFRDTTEGIARGVRAADGNLDGVGIDSWAVDFGLLDRSGALLSNPYHYRDARTEGMLHRAFSRVPKAEIYKATGIQFMPINTLYQLLALENSPVLEAANTLLMIPDLLGYWLTGEKAGEYTNATTTQLLDASTGQWARSLIERLGIPTHIFPDIVQPGTRCVTLLPVVAADAGLPEGLPVITVASHDTASAVVAVPAEGEDYAYISSGTWSLVGVETTGPVLSREALEANLTNEGGFGGTVRLLRNVMGLWLLQECRRTWARQGKDLPYPELARLAEEAPPHGPLIDPDHPSLLAPGDMPSRIQRLCTATGQSEPTEQGVMVRCVLESLALKYRWVLERLQGVSGQRIQAVHVVGGGSRNELLCQLTASACGLPVLAGPSEATALGNVLVQAYARGLANSLSEMRGLARASTELRCYEPGAQLEGQWERFERVMSGRL
ncbi:MAG: rhamnulokinase [Chloroflexota bacterium]|nr:rhamnulokinase [Chloroflexota bacterium]